VQLTKTIALQLYKYVYYVGQVAVSLAQLFKLGLQSAKSKVFFIQRDFLKDV